MEGRVGEKLAGGEHAKYIGKAGGNKAQKNEPVICCAVQKLSPFVVLSVFGYYLNTIYLRPMEKCESG